jgi:hypothetical protein
MVIGVRIGIQDHNLPLGDENRYEPSSQMELLLQDEACDSDYDEWHGETVCILTGIRHDSWIL